MFLQIDLVPTSGKLIKIPVVVKTQLQDEESREAADTAIQFFNEVTMYKIILPKLGGHELAIAPKMYYGEASGGEAYDKDLIVLEDLRPKGYKVPSKVWLDYDHVSITMKKLGQFHGLSYKLKRTSPEKFQQLANSLRTKKLLGIDAVCKGSMLRSFQQVLDNNPPYSVASRAYRKLSSKSASELSTSLNMAQEPFAVITHGDFNKNNVMYTYDETGKVVDVKFFDFAYSMFGEPTMDISFYLYLNTSPDLRLQHWSDFLSIYWDGVTSVIEDPGFTYDEFLKNFSQKAITGLIPSSFYLPLLLNPGCLDKEEHRKLPEEEKVNFFVTLGGDESTAAITAIVRHLLDSGYLEEFLISFRFV
uniref:CHK kinase-like domain-containing protein n=1 Tax=Lygus hesperus TaxID=30085 RepID=A0A0K8T795_LYGHE